MESLEKYASRSIALKRLMAPGVQMPVYALVFVTSRCNAACEHCFYWEELNKHVREELTPEEHEKLSQSLGPMFQITFTGGSPELRRDLPDIVESYYRNCRPANITFCMLGYATDRILAHTEQFLKRCPSQQFKVAISLDGLGEEHDRLRRLPGLFDRVVDTLKKLGDMKPHYPNLRLDVGITVHGLNYETAKKTALWAREHLPIDILKPILVRGNPLNPDARDESCVAHYLDVVNQDLSWVRGERGHRFSPIDFLFNAKEKVQRELIGDIGRSGRTSITCAGGRETTVIYPTGNIAGCELRGDVLANIREVSYNFRKAWFNDNSDHFRATSGKVEACQGCYHHCFISPALFRTPKLWPRMLETAWDIYRNQGGI